MKGGMSGNVQHLCLCLTYPLQYSWASLVAQLVKHLPAMRETWVLSLEWEDLSWRRERLPTLVFWPGEFHELYSPWGCKELDTNEQLSLHSLTPPVQLALITPPLSSWDPKTEPSYSHEPMYSALSG